MVHTYNAGDGEPNEERFLVAIGRYKLRVIRYEEKTSTKGNYMVVVDVDVISAHDPQNDGYKGKEIRYHNVVFIPEGKPGAGFAKLFLKCIGESYKGTIKIIPARWLNKPFDADVDIETYEGKKRNVLTPVDTEEETPEEIPGSEEPESSTTGSIVDGEETVPF